MTEDKVCKCKALSPDSGAIGITVKPSIHPLSLDIKITVPDDLLADILGYVMWLKDECEEIRDDFGKLSAEEYSEALRMPPCPDDGYDDRVDKAVLAIQNVLDQETVDDPEELDAIFSFLYAELAYFVRPDAIGTLEQMITRFVADFKDISDIPLPEGLQRDIDALEDDDCLGIVDDPDCFDPEDE